MSFFLLKGRRFVPEWYWDLSCGVGNSWTRQQRSFFIRNLHGFHGNLWILPSELTKLLVNLKVTMILLFYFAVDDPSFDGNKSGIFPNFPLWDQRAHW